MGPIDLINVHAEGEIGYVAYAGLPDIPGDTLAAKLAYLNDGNDELRRFLTLAPRGNPAASVNLLVPPTCSDADAAFIILQPDQAHASSGSNSICVATAVLEAGLVPMQEPETILRLETAAGMVTARVKCAKGKAQRVHLEMVPSFVHEMGVTVTTVPYGVLDLDICFGGIYYALVDADQLGLSIRPEHAAQLAAAGMDIKTQLNRDYAVTHPEIPEITGVAYVMFRGRDVDGAIRTATTMWPGRLDRSPCGTGSSAQLAVMHARGEVQVGDSFVSRSVIGSEFTVSLRGLTEVAGQVAVQPGIAGRGWLFGRQQIIRDPTDPFYDGIAITDVWGPAAGQLNE